MTSGPGLAAKVFVATVMNVPDGVLTFAPVENSTCVATPPPLTARATPATEIARIAAAPSATMRRLLLMLRPLDRLRQNVASLPPGWRRSGAVRPVAEHRVAGVQRVRSGLHRKDGRDRPRQTWRGERPEDKAAGHPLADAGRAHDQLADRLAQALTNRLVALLVGTLALASLRKGGPHRCCHAVLGDQAAELVRGHREQGQVAERGTLGEPVTAGKKREAPGEQPVVRGHQAGERRERRLIVVGVRHAAAIPAGGRRQSP